MWRLQVSQSRVWVLFLGSILLVLSITATNIPVLAQQTGVFNSVEPTYSITAEPLFALPGDVVSWYITLQNEDATQATGQIEFSDLIPAEMEIQSVQASLGEAMIQGQSVQYSLQRLEPQTSATIEIVTQIRPSVSVPFTLTNRVSNARAQVLSVQTLPLTGETPWWRSLLILLAAGVVTAAFVQATHRVIVRHFG